MKTKKFYKTPSSKIVVIEDSEIIATSNEDNPDTPDSPQNTIYLPFVGESEENGFAD